MEQILSRLVKIQNLKGLHARATSAFVKTAEAFNAHITVKRSDGVTASGKSIMGLLMLAVPLGEEILIEASGVEADKALDALEKLVNDRFGEDA